MTEDRIEQLVTAADRAAPQPSLQAGRIAAAARKQAMARAIRRRYAIRAAAVITILGACVGGLLCRDGEPDKSDQVAQLEQEVRLLQERTDAAIGLIHEVLEKERARERVTALERELVEEMDVMDKIDQQIDRTAHVFLYQGERLAREFGDIEGAVAAYKRVILLRPGSEAAMTAKQRIGELRNEQSNGTIDKEI